MDIKREMYRKIEKEFFEYMSKNVKILEFYGGQKK